MQNIMPLNFVFLPHSICFGADVGLTVITAYIQTKSNLAAIKARRTELQAGEPVALIAAWDLEHHTAHLYCIDSLDTQCPIHLTKNEIKHLYHQLYRQSQKLYHDNPEHLLNTIRTEHMLPPLSCDKSCYPHLKAR